MTRPITRLIRDEIARRGVIRFAELMDLALYHPEHGYYLQPKTRTGKAGDFFTNVSVGSVYGQLLADQFAAMHQILGAPPRFTILEQGAEDGQLAFDILERLKQTAPQAYSATIYLVIEPHRAKQGAQQDRLAAFHSRVAWLSKLEEVRPFTGVAHAHELVDAFPVHLVEHHADGWHELGVKMEDDRLIYTPLPELAPELAAHLRRIPAPPPRTVYRTEVNLAALGWIQDIARVLHRGFVLVLDYGYPRDAYYAPHRREGTLSCYRRHQRDHDPLSALGEKDITAHVDFTSLAEAGITAGLELAGFTDQHHFMVGAAEKRLQELSGFTAATSGPQGRDARFLRELQTLLHPAHLGAAFRYLLLTRPQLPVPPCFKYGRDPRRELGIENA